MRTSEHDYYAILGLTMSASADEIHKAYLKLARRYHPDVNPRDSSAEESFKMVQEAYDILRDPKRREIYDRANPHPQNETVRSAANAPGANGPQPAPDQNNSRP